MVFHLNKGLVSSLSTPPHTLILDYSTSRIGTPTIEPWVEKWGQVSSLFIDSEESFPLDLLENGYTHVIHSGSELSINEPAPFTKRAKAFIQAATHKGVAQMGICYGAQLMCMSLVGGEAVRASPKGFEAGWGEVRFNAEGQSLLGVHPVERVWQHHFDEVALLPEGAIELATNEHTTIQAWVSPAQRLFGTQFHPEVVRRMGNKIFRKDQQLLEENGYDLEEIVLKGPSPKIGNAIFDYFVGSI